MFRSKEVIQRLTDEQVEDVGYKGLDIGGVDM